MKAKDTDLYNLTELPLLPNGKPDETETLRRWQRYIVPLAAKYCSRSADLDDYLQEARLGIVQACRKFDRKRSSDFKTFCIYRITSRLNEYRFSTYSVVSVPSPISKAHYHLKRLAKSYMKDGLDEDEALFRAAQEKDPTDPPERLKLRGYLDRLALNLIYPKTPRAEVKEKTAKKRRELVEGALLLFGHQTVPIEELMTRTVPPDYSIDNTMPDQLTPRNRQVLKWRYEGYNYREIAEKLYHEGFTSRILTRQAVRYEVRELERALQALLDTGEF